MSKQIGFINCSRIADQINTLLSGVNDPGEVLSIISIVINEQCKRLDLEESRVLCTIVTATTAAINDINF